MAIPKSLCDREQDKFVEDPAGDTAVRVVITDGDITIDEVNADIDGVYNGTTNTDPDNIGLIAHNRATTPGDSDQVVRVTSKQGATDTDVYALDVSLHDADGDEFTSSNPLTVEVTNAASIKDIFDTAFVQGETTVGGTQVEVKVGGSPLTDRKLITVFNDSLDIIYYGPTGVTTSGATKGIPIDPQEFFSDTIGPNLSVFVISAGASSSIIFGEKS